MQDVTALRAVIQAERLHSPIRAAMHTLIADCRETEPNMSKRTPEHMQVVQEAEDFSKWFFTFCWGDSKERYQKLVIEQINALCQKLDTLRTWREKLAYFVSSFCLSSFTKVCANGFLRRKHRGEA